jgi:putative endonuclease
MAEMQSRVPAVHILASAMRGTLYVGVTSDLPSRVAQHEQDLVEGFTRKYRIHDLVWFETHESMESTISREKAIKAWKRLWKIQLIESGNADWRDPYPDIL